MPPILELFVLWHPDDTEGVAIADKLLAHFHGNPFDGLMRDTLEVYRRSKGWLGPEDAPRPIPYTGTTCVGGVAPASFVVVVPVLGRGLAGAVEHVNGPWHRTLWELDQRQQTNAQIGVFPVLVHPGVTDAGTVLGKFFLNCQLIDCPDPHAPEEPGGGRLIRDLGQGLVKLLSGGRDADRLTVFISHTKRSGVAEEPHVATLIKATRDLLSHTRLAEFFDARDIEPGEDFEAKLLGKAATSALLALRTDLYATRPWCQKEVVVAKQAGMPVVMLDALSLGEERGSFLLDHAPRRRVNRDGDNWRRVEIMAGINRLVDECLKRALWSQQCRLNPAAAKIHWWAPHAPETITLLHWLKRNPAWASGSSATLRVLYPDPPLCEPERSELTAIARLAGYGGVDDLTPHTLAARGGLIPALGAVT